ncbi:DUF2975 domain-containing protein [Lacinutrix sp. WUR7]|uniref:DUF2975 domain-containing protein n=1 Tax=Lacinutrix sp. WUR7 TaxID=2653681 RepID=UPI00193E3F28|nr:DUF2975 domain-containing protein [Lacinutrix sp. WUR7]QRM88179.1 DUF2975 domain-containing protein [Lacinutrix sp. WUR7]
MKKIISKCAQAFFYVFSTCFVFIFLLSILSFLEKYFGFDMPFVAVLEGNENFNAQITIPFINAVFSYNFSYSILFMWLWLLFYSIYFYTLKDFFQIFTKNNLFNKESLKKLIIFFRLNLIPLAINILVVLYSSLKQKNENIEEELIMIFIHGCVGIIVYLYIDVFKKGIQLQEENNLTI